MRRCSSPAPLASLRNKLSGTSEANKTVRLLGDQTGLMLRPGLEVNRLGTPRSTSSIQRSVPTGLPRDTAIRRPSGDRRKKPLNAGSPTAPRGFPLRSTHRNWRKGLLELYSKIPVADTETCI